MADSIADLVRAGRLKSGTELHHEGRGTRSHERITAKVRATGIEVAGQLFATPTAAAKSVNGGNAVDGWAYWRLPNGEYLGVVRGAVWTTPLERTRRQPARR